MKQTLLQMTQDLLSALDSDEINSINDTTEAQQVVTVLRTTYFDIASRAELKRDFKVFQLTPSLDVARPVTMSLPDNVSDLHWVKYNMATLENPEMTMKEVKPLPLNEFLEMVLSMNSNDPTVLQYTQIIDGDDIKLLCRNDRGPEYYTSLDDTTLIFDSYDASVDNTLQDSKTLCYGQKDYPWLNEDTFVPPLDNKQFQLLLNEAKSLAFLELKQTTHIKAEKTSRSLWINQQSAKTKVPLQTGLQRTPNFGR